jgi:hypothetical protein
MGLSELNNNKGKSSLTPTWRKKNKFGPRTNLFSAWLAENEALQFFVEVRNAEKQNVEIQIVGFIINHHSLT